MPDAAAAPASPASVAPSLAAADRLSQPTRMPGRAGRCCRGREDSHVTTASATAAANVGYLHGLSRGRGGCAGVIDGWGRRRGLGEFVLGRSSFLSLPFAVDFFSLMRALILPLRKDVSWSEVGEFEVHTMTTNPRRATMCLSPLAD